MSAAVSAPETWVPINGTAPAGGFVVDTLSRIDSLAFYNAVFLASEGAEHRVGWTGSYGAACAPGTTSAAFRDDVRRRVNYYRAMCGLPANITFDADPAAIDVPAGSPRIAAATSKRTCSQASAYMNAFSFVFTDNYALSHTPSSSSLCYSANAWNGSFHSNLAIGYFGPKAIDVYMADDDLNDDRATNSNVGHRRWLLFSRARDMSSGDVPRSTYTDGSGSYPVLPANSLYVTGVFPQNLPGPAQFVSWPPAGYVPVVIKPLRWSISYPAASFTNSTANITLKGPNGAVIPVTILSHNHSGIGDNTLVFQPQQTTITGTADATFTTTITGISGAGVPGSWSWQTTFFNPAVLGITQTVSGPAQPPARGSDYQFTAAPLAGAYQVLVNTKTAPASHVENGDGANPDITTEKTGTYPVLQGAGSLSGIGFTPRSGGKSLHLCFPLDEDEIDYLPHSQSFTLGPEFIPSANTTISFHELFRWIFNVNRLSLEISTDGGNGWAELYGRNGAYTYSPGATYNSTAWDSAWKARSVSLAAYAGQPIRLRFILRPGNVSFDGPDLNHGCYVDDITLTDVSRLSTGVNNTLSRTFFKLDNASAGARLVSGSSYLIRVRPEIGTRYMGYSSALTVIPALPTGFETAWPALANDPSGDTDGDGIANLVEYGFGLSPSSPTQPNALPQHVWGPSGLTLSFAVPAGRNDLLYTAECTSDFSAWAPVANHGTADRPSFSVPVTSGVNCFMRLRVSQR